MFRGYDYRQGLRNVAESQTAARGGTAATMHGLGDLLGASELGATPLDNGVGKDSAQAGD